jgi:hypothetical protein
MREGEAALPRPEPYGRRIVAIPNNENRVGWHHTLSRRELAYIDPVLLRVTEGEPTRGGSNGEATVVIADVKSS